MLEIKNGHLKDHHMTNALRKLGNHPKFAPKLAMKVSRLIDAIYLKEPEIQQAWVALVKEHAQVDEKGDIIPREDPNGDPIPGSFRPKDSDKWDDAQEKFSRETFKIDADPVPLKELEGVGLTPLELRSMEPLVVETILV